MADTADSTPQAQARSKFSVPDGAVLALLGSRDENLRAAEELLDADVHVRGNEITLTGEPADVAFAERVFTELVTLAGRGQQLGSDAVRRTIAMLSAGTSESPAEVLSLDIISRRGRTIRPKTLNQKHYVDAIDKNTIVFGLGPAGTGKTYLAMAKAVQALQAKQVTRIILTRPAVEAGERLGYLPGTLNDKIDPYLRPLYDALHDMVEPESIPRLMQAGTIEVAPLAYMRGRAQPVTTKVLTPDGFRPIGELRVGDLVVGSDGEPTPVLGVYPQGEKDMYRVTAQDGSSVLACGEHLWTVRTASDRRRDKPWRVLETQEIAAGLGDARHELPVLTGPVRLPWQPVPVDPYALGRSFHAAGASVVPVAPPGGTSRGRGVAVLENPVATPLVAAPEGVAIPDVYLANTVEVRLALLQGLLDAAGAPVGQLGRTCAVRFETSSSALLNGVVDLVRSLGGVAHVVTADTDPAHVLDIRLPEGVEPFRLARKREKYRAAGGGGRPMRFVDSIEPEGRAEAVCIQVAAEDSLYVTEGHLLTHNTLNDAFIILDEAQNTTPEQMKMFLTRLGFGSKVVVTGDTTQVDLPGGQRSGLRVVRDILDGVEDVHFSVLTSGDVVRHKLVADIVDAYEKWQVEQDEQADGHHRGPGARARGERRGR
ncbi:PhoH family protein [Actinosynnema pretiosum subsp. pretiosum]|uniref:PhoH-like protein n=1 Tax=Actinosynnema pretiosum subsp. pretiosum TaxID=103721 RepID=A0AA45LC92_9PSEU|nr:Phosphate starvation-inducible protein PhoH, predicted ATPase [Actinosynnema pretiosum subsp. pretiosum]QUF07085.1 PhoH family protein [Actinosynnema pretiosum subsp. pretiosum]